MTQKLSVERQQFRQKRNRVNSLVAVGFPKNKERDRSQKDRAGFDAGSLGLVELSNGLGVGGELELLVVLQRGLDIVVVRVEPFHHFLIELLARSKEQSSRRAKRGKGAIPSWERRRRTRHPWRVSEDLVP